MGPEITNLMKNKYVLIGCAVAVIAIAFTIWKVHSLSRRVSELEKYVAAPASCGRDSVSCEYTPNNPSRNTHVDLYGKCKTRAVTPRDSSLVNTNTSVAQAEHRRADEIQQPSIGKNKYSSENKSQTQGRIIDEQYPDVLSNEDIEKELASELGELSVNSDNN